VGDKLPFSEFSRKEVGNGAPNDGLTLTEVHGWAFGTLSTGGPTLIHALLPGSPAINTGSNGVRPATDQRGVVRGAACNVGVFELVP
jgi:hypothetical protein